jgi:hypothetical protein
VLAKWGDGPSHRSVTAGIVVLQPVCCLLLRSIFHCNFTLQSGCRTAMCFYKISCLLGVSVPRGTNSGVLYSSTRSTWDSVLSYVHHVYQLRHSTRSTEYSSSLRSSTGVRRRSTPECSGCGVRLWLLHGQQGKDIYRKSEPSRPSPRHFPRFYEQPSDGISP